MQPRISDLTKTLRERQRPSGQPLVRAAISLLNTKIDQHAFADDFLKRAWPNDKDAAIILKSATAPASTTGSGWASQLAQTAVSDFILGLGPASAGAQLLRQGMQLNFDGNAAILVPGLLAAAGNVSFVAEGAAIPVREFAVSGTTLSPRSLKSLTSFTRELFNRSTPTVEALVSNMLTQSVGLALDTAMFDATSGDAIRPAGLLENINATTASDETDRRNAMLEDVAALVGAVSAVAGNFPIVLVASPKQATALRLWSRADLAFDVFASSALSDKVVIAVATNALASAIDPTPRFDVSDQAVLHMDSSPLPIDSGTTTTPVQAAPLISEFQQDMLSLRAIFKVSWGLRDPGGLAWTQSVLW